MNEWFRREERTAVAWNIIGIAVGLFVALLCLGTFAACCMMPPEGDGTQWFAVGLMLIAGLFGAWCALDRTQALRQNVRNLRLMERAARRSDRCE